jgi:tripartite-type tricarboxylate transporter receptor subunit TctC
MVANVLRIQGALPAACRALASLVCILVATVASAQQWPTKRIQVIVPLGAGSATDVVARTVLDAVATQLGQPIVIENRLGAGNTIGMAAVARAEPDGYTLLFSGGHSVVSITYPNLPFDVFQDLTPITPIGATPIVLVVSRSKGYKDVHDLVGAAKGQQGRFNYSMVGVGQITDFATEAFRIAAGFQAVRVSYRSTPEALSAVLTGQAEFYMSPLAAAFSLLKDGRLQALAITGAQRASQIPDVPTLKESGFSLVDYSLWVGLFAPGKTPEAILDRLHRETTKVIQSPSMKEKFAKLGVDPMLMESSAFRKMINDEFTRNAEIAKVMGIKPQ